MKPFRQNVFAALAALMLAFAPFGPAGALTVFDPKNFSQNLLTAVRTLQMINNQINQLQNEARMLTNMAKHLERMDYSSLAAINRAISQINILMAQAEGITFDVRQTERVFAERFPKLYEDSMTNDALAADARARWDYAMDAFRQTMRVQAQVSRSVLGDQVLIGNLVAASQSSVGTLQAQQATNQLIALTAQQTAKSQQLMAAQYRADSLDAARKAASLEQTRARFSRFIGDGQAYAPAQ